jgi:hypothetical protein
MMSHEKNQGSEALQIAFIANGVVEALEQIKKQEPLSLLNKEYLTKGVNLLADFSAWVESPTRTINAQPRRLHAFNTLNYGTSALLGIINSGGNPSLHKFSLMEKLLGRVNSTSQTSDIDDLIRFFAALSNLTRNNLGHSRRMALWRSPPIAKLVSV